MVSVAKGTINYKYKYDFIFIFKSLIKMSDIKIIKCIKIGKNMVCISGLDKYTSLV